MDQRVTHMVTKVLQQNQRKTGVKAAVSVANPPTTNGG